MSVHLIPILALSATGGRWQSLSPAAQILIAVLPLAAVVLLAALSFFFILLDYRRSRLIIERGLSPVPRNIAAKTGLGDSLLGGIVPTAAGLGIITYYALMQAIKKRRQGASGR